MEEGQQRKGTTTVGVVSKDAVVLAADKRATMGYLIANKDVEKILKITDTIALTIAGMASDGQMLAKLLAAEMELYRMNSGSPPSLSVAANLLANIVFERAKSYMPYYIQVIIGGLDGENEPGIYTLDMGGSLIKEKQFYSTGSGSPVAFGVLEDNYKEGITTEQAIDLAIRALSSALKRDCATGDGIDVIVIDRKGGFRRIEKDRIMSVARLK
ncbi:MAG: archaeal proteasome endopeptidase complex subunit beta [archaeon]